MAIRSDVRVVKLDYLIIERIFGMPIRIFFDHNEADVDKLKNSLKIFWNNDGLGAYSQNFLIMIYGIFVTLFVGCHDTHHNDTQHNDTQHERHSA